MLPDRRSGETNPINVLTNLFVDLKNERYFPVTTVLFPSNVQVQPFTSIMQNLSTSQIDLKRVPHILTLNNKCYEFGYRGNNRVKVSTHTLRPDGNDDQIVWSFFPDRLFRYITRSNKNNPHELVDVAG